MVISRSSAYAVAASDTASVKVFTGRGRKTTTNGAHFIETHQLIVRLRT